MYGVQTHRGPHSVLYTLGAAGTKVGKRLRGLQLRPARSHSHQVVLNVFQACIEMVQDTHLAFHGIFHFVYTPLQIPDLFFKLVDSTVARISTHKELVRVTKETASSQGTSVGARESRRRGECLGCFSLHGQVLKKKPKVARETKARFTNQTYKATLSRIRPFETFSGFFLRTHTDAA